MGVKTSKFGPTHDFLEWGVEWWEIFSVDIIIIELLLTIEGAKMVGGAVLSSHTRISNRMPINYWPIMADQWVQCGEPGVPRDWSHSPFLVSSVSRIWVQCPCSPIYLPHTNTLCVAAFTSHTLTNTLCVAACIQGGRDGTSLEPVIVRFVCSEDTERGWERIRASYFWVVLGPHANLLGVWGWRDLI